jgi:hypothetical protein
MSGATIWPDHYGQGTVCGGGRWREKQKIGRESGLAGWE